MRLNMNIGCSGFGGHFEQIIDRTNDRRAACKIAQIFEIIVTSVRAELGLNRFIFTEAFR